MTYNSDVKYAESHEWAKLVDKLVIVGISDFAQDSLGDVVFVELPEVGSVKKKGENFGTVESVKAASDVYMPISGEIVEVNESLENEPENINSDPFGAGWILKIKPADISELDQLMKADEYKSSCEA